jgi:hypothetical protein
MQPNRGFLLALSIAVFALAGDLEAQYVAAPNGFGIGVSVGAVTYSDSVQSFNAGGGADASVRYTFNALQLVGGGGYAVVSVKDLDANRKVWNIFGDLRLSLKSSGQPGIAPYIGGRLGYVWSSVDITELDLSGLSEAKTSGWTFAGLIGALFPLSPKFAIDGQFTFGVASLGDIEFNTGDKLENSSESGVTGSLRVGIVYSFGGY